MPSPCLTRARTTPRAPGDPLPRAQTTALLALAHERVEQWGAEDATDAPPPLVRDVEDDEAAITMEDPEWLTRVA